MRDRQKNRSPVLIGNLPGLGHPCEHSSASQIVLVMNANDLGLVLDAGLIFVNKCFDLSDVVGYADDGRKRIVRIEPVVRITQRQ